MKKYIIAFEMPKIDAESPLKSDFTPYFVKKSITYFTICLMMPVILSLE